MKETFNRWQVLAASTAILLCTGAVYSFSVFAGLSVLQQMVNVRKSCSHLQLTQHLDLFP